MKWTIVLLLVATCGYAVLATSIKRSEDVGTPDVEEEDLETPSKREEDSSGELEEISLRALDMRPGRGLDMRPGRGLDMRPGRGLDMRPGRGLDMRPGRGLDMRPGRGLDMRPGRDLEKRLYRSGPKPVEKRAPASCSAKYAKAPFPSTMCEYEDAPGIRDLGVSPTDRRGIVDLHNKYRSGVQPSATNMQTMYWDDEIAEVAQKWAQTCVPGHDEGYNRRVPNWHIVIGQNWAGGFPTWSEVITAWYDEVKDFTYGSQNPLEKVGHYTQIVGSSAARIGCGYAYCPNNNNPQNYVCNYAFGQSDFDHPYNAGRGCADCPGKCRNGQCDCGGRICKNGGTMDVGTCSCQCPENTSGAECENLQCPGAEGYPCGTAPYDKTACKKFAAFPAMCPILCGVCANNCPHMTAESCENEGTVNPDCSCKCKDGFAGQHCEKFASCKADLEHCGKEYPYGYPKEYCDMYANIPEECPHMCGMC